MLWASIAFAARTRIRGQLARVATAVWSVAVVSMVVPGERAPPRAGYARGVIDSVSDLRPKLRGVLHEVAFFVALGVGVVFVVFTPSGRVAPATAFAVSAVVMLGTSALYHRVRWGPSARLWMRRADHAGIFILIAGTYT